MADGPVGQFLLRYLLQEHSNDLKAIVLVDQAAWNDFPRELLKYCSGTKRLTWNRRFELKEDDLNVLFLAWWPYLLSLDDLTLAPTILNMHPSLLPHCRGKDPNFWTIVEQRPFGVTIHHVENSIDGGPIAFQRRIPVSWEDTGQTLYESAKREIIQLFIDNYAAIASGNIPRIPQVTGEGSIHFRRELEAACSLDLNAVLSARDLINLLRARTFPPHPACSFTDDGKKYEITIKISRK